MLQKKTKANNFKWKCSYDYLKNVCFKQHNNNNYYYFLF